MRDKQYRMTAAYAALEEYTARYGKDLGRVTALALLETQGISLQLMDIRREFLMQIEVVGHMGYAISPDIGYTEKVLAMTQRLNEIARTYGGSQKD